jgi:HAD superfamily hydrolase (TIGR01509 family)
MNKHVESDLMLKALIFDVDGTLADTESAHLAAFNHAFAEQGLDWHWDVALYTSLLEISGGKERMLHYWKHVHPDMKDIDGSGLRDTIDHHHALKTASYEAAVQGGAVQLRPGVLALIQQAHQQGLRLAIATTTSPVNIAVLLRNAIGPDWKDLFIVIEDASTAPKKKPHPQVYVQTLARLGLPSGACLALEDSSNGLRAAVAAGIKTIITPNNFTSHHDFTGALQVLPNLEGVSVEQLRTWHQA